MTSTGEDSDSAGGRFGSTTGAVIMEHHYDQQYVAQSSRVGSGGAPPTAYYDHPVTHYYRHNTTGEVVGFRLWPSSALPGQSPMLAASPSLPARRQTLVATSPSPPASKGVVTPSDISVPPLSPPSPDQKQSLTAADTISAMIRKKTPIGTAQHRRSPLAQVQRRVGTAGHVAVAPPQRKTLMVPVATPGTSVGGSTTGSAPLPAGSTEQSDHDASTQGAQNNGRRHGGGVDSGHGGSAGHSAAAGAQRKKAMGRVKKLQAPSPLSATPVVNSPKPNRGKFVSRGEAVQAKLEKNKLAARGCRLRKKERNARLVRQNAELVAFIKEMISSPPQCPPNEAHAQRVLLAVEMLGRHESEGCNH